MGHRPKERNTPQIPEKKRWIAERRRGPADVRNEKNEEDHDHGALRPPSVGAKQQRLDEEHRSTGGADERGDRLSRARGSSHSTSASRRSFPSITTPPEMT
jgi:hypothetical protein